MIHNFKPTYLYVIIIAAFSLFLYLPILAKPQAFFNRGNDLEETFVPVFQYIHQQYQATGTIPLWNTLYFAGTPLLPDPQYSPYYPPHLLFLFFSAEATFLPILISHTILAGIGFFFLCRHCLKFSPIISLTCGLFYLTSPKLAGFLEAGHTGLLEGSAWLPTMALSAGMIIKKPNSYWSILLSVSLAACFYTHTVIFSLSLPIILSLGLISLIHQPWRKSFIFYLLSLILLFGEIAITLLPQLDWFPQTTRRLLLSERDVYPKWNSIKEFIFVTIAPFLNGFASINKIDTEKWLTSGLTTTLLSVVGFLSLSRKVKVLVTVTVIAILLICLNNASPIYQLLLKQDWYVLMRVSTRVWIFITILICLLAGLGVKTLINHKASNLFVLLVVLLALIENITLSWTRFQKSPPTINFAPESVYQFLRSDPDRFRVFCTTRCLSQKTAQQYQLELLDGYNTLAQINYHQQMWQLTQSYWGYYSLSIPPIGLYTFKQIQPDPISLGQFNTKYIISPHLLTDPRFKLIQTIDGFSISLNTLFLPRAHFLTSHQSPVTSSPILIYTPNFIRLDTSAHLSNSVVISQIYNHNWTAYLNGLNPTPVLEKPNALTQVDIKPTTNFIDLKYQPRSLYFGQLITKVSLCLILLLLLIKYIHPK